MENLVGNSLFIRYRVALAGLCSCCAELVTVKEQMKNGEIIEPFMVQNLCDKLSYSKTEFIDAKEALGFNDGLAFMEDNRFAGFSIENGCLIGNPEKAYLILRPWYENFPEKGNNYQFEVANYLLAFIGQRQRLETETLNSEVAPAATLISVRDTVKRKWKKCINKVRHFLYQ